MSVRYAEPVLFPAVLPIHDYREQTSTASNGLVLLSLLITSSVELSRPALWHSRIREVTMARRRPLLKANTYGFSGYA